MYRRESDDKVNEKIVKGLANGDNSCAIAKNPMSARLNSWSSRNSRPNPENTPLGRPSTLSANRNSMADAVSAGSSKTIVPSSPRDDSSPTSSPRKENAKAGSLSPVSSRKEIVIGTPRSSI